MLIAVPPKNIHCVSIQLGRMASLRHYQVEVQLDSCSDRPGHRETGNWQLGLSDSYIELGYSTPCGI